MSFRLKAGKSAPLYRETISFLLVFAMFPHGQQVTGPIAAPPTARQAPPPGTKPPGFEVRTKLKEGTEVHLKLAQTLTSRTATVDEPVEFVLAEDLKVDGDIVARKGTRVLGVVAEGKKSEKERTDSSALSVRFDHMKVGSKMVKLRGQAVATGKRDAAKMVTFGILFGLAGVAATSGKKFTIAEGTPATAYVDEDIELPVLPANPT
jgi:hypothetical protein